MRRRRVLLGIGVIAALVLGLLLALAALSPRGSAVSVTSGDRIGVVEVRGFIADARSINEALRYFRDTQEVKAVLVRVESPGGLVAPSQEMHDEVSRTKAVKPVVVSMGTVAASGGYYLSAPATQIVANPGTATGSIGVILQFPDFHVILDKFGYRTRVLKSGPLKDAGSPFREMTETERKVLQGLVDDIFSQFVDAVAAGRRMDRKAVLELADGRVYSGRQAQKLGLVDRLGGFWDAVALAQELAGLKGKPRLEYRARKSGGLLRLLLGEDSDALAPFKPAAGPPLRFALPGW
jgi:protease-4